MKPFFGVTLSFLMFISFWSIASESLGSCPVLTAHFIKGELAEASGRTTLHTTYLFERNSFRIQNTDWRISIPSFRRDDRINNTSVQDIQVQSRNVSGTENHTPFNVRCMYRALGNNNALLAFFYLVANKGLEHKENKGKIKR